MMVGGGEAHLSGWIGLEPTISSCLSLLPLTILVHCDRGRRMIPQINPKHLRSRELVRQVDAPTESPCMSEKSLHFMILALSLLIMLGHVMTYSPVPQPTSSTSWMRSFGSGAKKRQPSRATR